MASSNMDTEILATREGLRVNPDTENATPVIAPREGELDMEAMAKQELNKPILLDSQGFPATVPWHGRLYWLT